MCNMYLCRKNSFYFAMKCLSIIQAWYSCMGTAAVMGFLVLFMNSRLLTRFLTSFQKVSLDFSSIFFFFLRNKFFYLVAPSII